MNYEFKAGSQKVMVEAETALDAIKLMDREYPEGYEVCFEVEAPKPKPEVSVDVASWMVYVPNMKAPTIPVVRHYNGQATLAKRKVGPEEKEGNFKIVNGSLTLTDSFQTMCYTYARGRVSFVRYQKVAGADSYCPKAKEMVPGPLQLKEVSRRSMDIPEFMLELRDKRGFSEGQCVQLYCAMTAGE